MLIEPTLARYAVMGAPIAHSLSPMIHQAFAHQTGCRLIYQKIDMELPRFEQQVMDFFNQGGKGLNISSPGKQRAFAMSAKPSPRALAAKAANTLWMEAGFCYADNTDGVGLLRDLTRYIELADAHLLLLGAGGAARGVIDALLDAHPASLTVANRSLAKAEALQEEVPMVQVCALADLLEPRYDVIINATSAYHQGSLLTLPKTIMATKPFCYDLAYDTQGQTAFVKFATEAGSVAVDGLGMLLEQAAEAFFIWHGVRPDTAPVWAMLRQEGADSLFKACP